MAGGWASRLSRSLSAGTLRWTAALAQIPPDRVAGRLLRAPLRILRRATVPVIQGPLRGCWWTVASAPHSFWLGVWEHDKMRAFADRIAEGDVVYDVGAHAGIYTLLAARRAGRAGRVVAFEPEPGNLRNLDRHIRINHFQNVTVIPAAVGSHSGRGTFVEGPTSGMGHLGPRGREVSMVSLDQLCGSGEIPAPKVIKIDVEGGEHDVLIGARELLGTQPTIFLATHGRVVHDHCCRLLESVGYAMTPLDADHLDEASEILAGPRLQRDHFGPGSA